MLATTLLAAGGAALAGGAWFAWRRTVEVPCTLDLESTPEHFHAHVALREDVLVSPGDEVLVHGAPDHIPLGTQRTLDARATVRHASPPRRWWTRLTGGTAFHELYDVGFEG